MNEDQRNNCRVSLRDLQGGKRGCGFIIGPRHVLTCTHVVLLCQPLLANDLTAGAPVNLVTDAGEPVVMAVETVGGLAGAAGFIDTKFEDICLLRRADAATFPDRGIAAWAPAVRGRRFIGLGITKKNPNGVAIVGRVETRLDDSGNYLVAGDDDDRRIEEGCSGAAVFDEGDDGALIGMVARYQQQRSGQIIPAQTLAELFPAFAKAPDPVSGFAALVPAPRDGAVQIADLPRKLKTLDRKQQKDPFVVAIAERGLLREHGLVMTMLKGVEQDLPFVCADYLGELGFRAFLDRISPDAQKPVRRIVWNLTDLLDDDEAGLSRNLRLRLYEELNAGGTQIDDLSAAMACTLAPLPIILLARPEDLDRVTERTCRVWADLLGKLAKPAENQPIALFVLIDAPVDAAPANPSWPLADERFIALEQLGPVSLAHVTAWARGVFADDGDLAERVTARVRTSLGTAAGMRMGKIKALLSEGV